MMRYIHFKDDFSIRETFYSDEGAGKVAIPVPERVEIVYFTSSGHGSFWARRNGDHFENCELSADGNTLIVNISLRERPIGHGRLLRIATQITADPSFPDELKYTRYPAQLDAVLYLGKTDSPLDLTSEIVFGLSGVTLERVWQSLKNNTDFPGEKIHIEHIPPLPISAIDGLQDALDALDREIPDVAVFYDAIQSFQSQIDAISSRNNYDELTATVLFSEQIATSEIYAQYAHAERYYLTDEVYFYTEKINNQVCVRLNAPFITSGDQIVIDGEPGGGGGGGGGVPYLHELLDVDIDDETIVPGQILVWDGEKWVNEDPSEGSVTSVVLEQGDANGTFHLVVNGVAGTDVPVKGLDDSLSVISQALQSFQSQIDAVSARDMFDELTATVVSSDVLTATEAYMGYAHASRYYLTDSIYFWAESVNGVMCVRLNAPLITAGDQIVISGTPGGGGGGGGSMYLHELLDVTITLPSNGQTLFYQDGIWVNGNIDFSNYYTKTQVDDIIGTIQQFHYEVYASLEDVTDPQSNVLYLIGPTGSGSDKYEEYVYANGAWTKIGDTSIDLSGYVQTSRLEADEAILAEAIQSLQSQIDAVSARNNYDELTATSFYADMMAATYAYAERYYLTDDVYFSIEKVNGTACVRLNAPFITDGDQIIISGTPGSGGGGSGVTLYDYTQVKAMTADVALTVPSAWAMHQMWAEIFGGASSVLTSGNYTNYVNTTNFPGLDKLGTVTSVATGTGLAGGPITSAGVISIDPTYLGYISHGETAYGWGDILTQAIQSFQSQIDSVSARDAFDELTATALYADTGAISALYAGSIELGGEDLATAVSGIRGRLTSVENKFDADGSALSAVRLKTARTLWGQNYDGTANVVGNMTDVGSLTASGLIKTTNYAQAQRFYLTDSIYFYTETIDGVACVMLNAPFVTSGDQIIISGTPGGGGQGVGYLYELEDVSDALASPTNGMVLFYNGTEWVGVAASSIGGVTSVVGQTGAVTTEQVASALTAAGYKLTDTITTSLAWSAITNTPTTLAEYGITDAASASAISTLATRVGTLEGDEAVVSAAIQSLQSQIDSVSARDQYDELTATALFADTLSASSAYIESITGSLSGNAATASRLVGASYNVGNVNKPVYFSGGLPVETTYAIYAALFNGTAGRLAYYSTANIVSDYMGTIGSATQPMHLVAGVPTACTYTLGAALLAATTGGKLAYYSGTNSVSSYTSTIGSGVIPMYLNAGVPTASTSTVGSAALPVYLYGGTITACSGASIFSHIGSNSVNNLELTIAGQLRTATLYATYDNAGENISDKFGIVGQAIQSLQSQVDSVSARNSFDEVMATVGFIDTLSVGDAVYSTKGCIAQYLTVGQTSIAAYPLYVVGVIASTGDQVVTSDATKKTNLKDIALSVGQIASAPAVTFDWKAGGHSFGSIAQYWRGVLPESVLGDEGDYSLAYAQLALVSAINLARHETEQDQEIRKLKEKVARLENEVERLRN